MGRQLSERASLCGGLDEKYFEGVVESFDKPRQRHTVFYDDGDIERIPRWAANQIASLCDSQQIIMVKLVDGMLISNMNEGEGHDGSWGMAVSAEELKIRHRAIGQASQAQVK